MAASLVALQSSLDRVDAAAVAVGVVVTCLKEGVAFRPRFVMAGEALHPSGVARVPESVPFTL